MKTLNRRSFMKSSALATSVLALGQMIPGRWLTFAYAEPGGYFESQFGITDALCKKILDQALARGGDFADLYFEHMISNWLTLEDGRVDRAYASIDLGVGIRTVKGEQVGYGFTQELTEKSMLAAASTAASIANSTAKPAAKKFVKLETSNYYPLKTLLIDVPLESKLPLVQNVNKKCFDLSNLVIKVSAGFHDSQKRMMIVTSDGIKAEDLLPRNYLYSSVIAEKNGKKERASWNFGGRRDFSYYTDKLVNAVAEETVKRAVVLFDAVQPPAGEMPAVLGPGITGILLHEAIGHGMEADFNRKKMSTYSNMIGKKVAEPFVTIIDDGTNPHLLGALNVDDEGFKTKKTVLVENGILKSYLHDRISARYYNVEPTGSGRRESFQHYPQPRMRNTYMLPGDNQPADVIKNVKKGIYIENVSNGEVKIGEGDFAFYVSQGRMIEDGKLTAPIKDMNIMGNGPKMLENITMIANDLVLYEGGGGSCGKGGQLVPVSFGLPTCLVKSMTVGGVQKQGAQS